MLRVKMNLIGVCRMVALISLGFLLLCLACSRDGGRGGINKTEDLGDPIPGEAGIILKPGLTYEDAQDLASDYGLRIDLAFPEYRVYGVEWDDNRPVELVIWFLSQDPRVEEVEAVYWGEVLAVPNDPAFTQQWALQRIQAEEAWDIETGSKDIVVAVVDTGTNYNHPDLAANIWKNKDEVPDNGIDDDRNGYVDDVCGWNFIHNNDTPLDDFFWPTGHGTPVAGIISAVTNNGIGISGVTWKCKIMPVKTVWYDGSGDPKVTALGIRYAVDNGAKVINLSLGWYTYSFQLAKAINYAVARGALVVAGMGNDFAELKMYPAALPNVIAVGSTQQYPEGPPDTMSDISNWGWWMDVVAPGRLILSLGRLGLAILSDTSFATPHVSGLVALMLSRNPSLSYSEIAPIIRDTADFTYYPPGSLGKIRLRINAYNALQKTPLEMSVSDSIRKGLKWLASVQNPQDGSWAYADGRGEPRCVGVTALCVLAFINAGAPRGHPAVSKGLSYLISHINPDGSIDRVGWLGRVTTKVYETSCALWALLAAKFAYGTTEFDKAIEGARNYLIKTQCLPAETDRTQYGGWGYPADTGLWADLSNTQFAALALYASRWPDVRKGMPHDTKTRLERYLRRAQLGDGGFRYGEPLPPQFPEVWLGGNPYGSMTAAGVWTSYTLGLTVQDELIKRAKAWLDANYSCRENPRLGGLWYYYWLWTAAKAFHFYNWQSVGGRDWYKELTDYLIRDTTSPYRQQADGSWPRTPEEPKVLATAWAILTLQVKQTIVGKLEFILGSNARLHVYDPLGRHTGFDPQTGLTQTHIPHSQYSGPDVYPQVITIGKYLRPGTYSLVVEGIKEGMYTLTVNSSYNGNYVTSERYISYISPGERVEWEVTVGTVITPVTVDVNFPPNQRPVADAGGPYLFFADDVLLDVDPDTLNRQSQGRWITAYLEPDPYGTALVAMDGRASFDPEGMPLTYRWVIYDTTERVVLKVKGPTPTFELPVGTYRVELIVNDGIQDSRPSVTSLKIKPVELIRYTDDDGRLLPSVELFLNNVAAEWGQLQDEKLMVKFPRGQFIERIQVGDQVEVRLTGDLKGIDRIRVIE